MRILNDWASMSVKGKGGSAELAVDDIVSEEWPGRKEDGQYVKRYFEEID